MAIRFDKLAQDLKEQKPLGTSLRQAVEIVLPYLDKIGSCTTPQIRDHEAQITVEYKGPKTNLFVEIQIHECFIDNTAMATTRAVVEDHGFTLKSDTLPFETLVGDRVTTANAGPSLTALIAVKEAIDDGIDYLQAYQIAKDTYFSARRVEKFGTDKKIRLNIPYNEKDQAKAKHPGRLLWNKTERTWYYHGKDLPEDLEPYRDELAPATQ